MTELASYTLNVVLSSILIGGGLVLLGAVAKWVIEAMGVRK